MIFLSKTVIVIFVASLSSIMCAKNESSTFEQPRPEDSSTWESIRMKNKIYENETSFLDECLDDHRRFDVVGTSTSFLQMAQKFFRGNQSLFRGSAIYERGNAEFARVYKPFERLQRLKVEGRWLSYPVVYMDFGSTYDFNTMEHFENEYNRQMQEVFNFYAPGDAFDPSEEIRRRPVQRMVQLLYRRFQLPVVVLIDRYDVPIDFALRTGQEELAKEILEFFNDTIEGSLKNFDEICLVLMTVASSIRENAIKKGNVDLRDFIYNVENLVCDKIPRNVTSHYCEYKRSYN